jgi:hypothetical protein
LPNFCPICPDIVLRTGRFILPKPPPLARLIKLYVQE